MRAVAREILNGLKNTNETQTIVNWLYAAKCLSTETPNIEFPQALEQYSDVPFSLLRSTYREQHFATLCCAVLDQLSVEWMQILGGSNFSERVEVLFLEGPAADALLALDHAVQKYR